MANHTDKTITIQLLEAGSADLRLDDFLEELGTLRIALRETERLVSGREPSLYFRIRRLQKSSPAVIELEAVTDAQDDRSKPEFASLVVRSFATNLRLISKSKLPRKIDIQALESYRDLALPIEKHSLEVKIQTGNHSVLLNRNFRQVLEAVMGSDEVSYGSVSGKIEAINLHNRNRFWLYPTLGARRIRGKFKVKDRKRFKAGVDEYVTVYGWLRYKTWDKYPYAVFADDIQVHDTAVPTLRELKGVAPEATGELTTQEYLDQVRDDG